MKQTINPAGITPPTLTTALFTITLIATAFLGTNFSNAEQSTTEQNIAPSDLVGVWTTTSDGPDHHLSSEGVAESCSGFKMIIHADMRVEAITLGEAGGYMLWAVADRPCLFKHNTLACEMNVYTQKRMISQNRQVAWSLTKIRSDVYDSHTLLGSASKDTMYRCAEDVQETSAIAVGDKI